MARRVPAWILLGAVAAFAFAPAWGQRTADSTQPDVRITGPPSTKLLLLGLAKALLQAKNLKLGVAGSLTSPDALDTLAQQQADIAIVTRPLTGEDRARYPDLNLAATPIGMQVVAIGVSDDVWESGVRTITKENMRAVYEQKITNWKQLGGPDEKITLFTFEQGQGIWENFAEWLYGDNRKAPLPKVTAAANSKDAADDLEFTPGAIVMLGAGVVDGTRCQALGIDLPDRIAKPRPEDVSQGKYPIVRPLVAVTINAPALETKVVTEFLTGQAGQMLVKQNGALGLDAVPKAKDEFAN